MKKRLVLLDSHAILHRGYHALPDFSTAAGEPTGALFGLTSMILGIAEGLKPDYIVAAFDLPKPTHRHDAYKDYKAGRAKTDDALVAQIKRSRDIFAALGIPVYDKEGFEADDMLGTIVEKVKKDKNLDIVIASGDMDTLQLVSDDKVRVYTLKKGIKDTIIYNEDAVRERFGFGPELLPDYKGLRGDPSDNIKGIKGIGEKTATTLITTFGSIEDMYKALKKDKAAFAKKSGLTPRLVDIIEAGEEDAEFSKVLATIRRDAPIDWGLPAKAWKDSIDMDQVTALFAALEFRTMGARLKGIIDGTGIRRDEDTEKQEKGAERTKEDIPADKLREATIMLWLVNSNITDPQAEDIYNFTKAKTFDEAYRVLTEEIKKKNLAEVYETIERPLIPICERMQETGVKIDAKKLKALSDKFHKELSALEKGIWRQAGEEFNIASPKQLAEILYTKMGLVPKRQKKTAGGAMSTKESELEKIVDMHPIVSDIMRYRELSKLLGTYVDAIPKLLDGDSRLHATFIQTGAVTGRMATRDPGIQNIPNRTDEGRQIRDAFVAEKGYKIVSLDYSQIELRIAAFLSGDKKFIDIFKRGEDVHSAVASEVYGVPADKVTKTMRSQAKVINFGVMYGMGVTALQKNLNTDRATAQKFLNDYFERFSGLAAYLDRVKGEAARLGYTETFFGRRRYFDGIKSKIPFIRAAAERMAVNAPIQGTEADIVKLAMIELEKHVAEEGLGDKARILMQVHDEIVYEVKSDIAEDFARKAKEIMESIIPPEKIYGIVCVAEGSIGDNWGEGLQKVK
ncbi:MAG: DNA polymerase [Candidatus Paceibacterota bacterium]